MGVANAVGDDHLSVQVVDGAQAPYRVPLRIAFHGAHVITADTDRRFQAAPT